MSRFHKFLGSATRLLHLKNFPFGVVVASAPQIKTFSCFVGVSLHGTNRLFIVASVP